MLYAGTVTSGVFRSADQGVTWKALNTGLTSVAVNAVTGSAAGLFAGTEWTESSRGLEYVNVYAFAASGSNLFAATWNGVLRSSNNGADWTPVNIGLADTYTNALAASGTTLYAGTNGTGVFRSVDNGAHWSAVDSGLTNKQINCLAATEANVIAGTAGGVFMSSDHGTSWIAATGAPASGTFLLAGTADGVYRSADSGATWSKASTGMTMTLVNSLAVSGANVFAAGGGPVSVFLSPNNAESWSAVNTGLPSSSALSVAVFGTHLFAGSSGLWLRPLPEMNLSAVEGAVQEPVGFDLGQNYPNPFNPSTTISFSLPARARVKLAVYDVLGKIVSTLIDGDAAAGTHRAVWNGCTSHGSPAASGAYVYRLESNGMTHARTMLLMK